jgi:hypothetical protein
MTPSILPQDRIIIAGAGRFNNDGEVRIDGDSRKGIQSQTSDSETHRDTGVRLYRLSLEKAERPVESKIHQVQCTAPALKKWHPPQADHRVCISGSAKGGGRLPHEP